jgi:hypothetical protein
MPISFKYICVNPSCPAVKYAAEKRERRRAKKEGDSFREDNVKLDLAALRVFTADGILGQSAKNHLKEMKRLGSSFTGHQSRVIRALPKAARQLLCGFEMFDQKGGCTTALAERVITARTPLAETAAALRNEFQLRQKALLVRYHRFAKAEMQREQKKHAVVAKWPPFTLPELSCSLLVPSARNLRRVILNFHATWKPYLLADMVRRTPGEGISSDGTFRLMMRTRSDGKVLILFIGDDHTIVSWYVCQSESWTELKPGLLFLKERLRRFNCLENLKYWWSDRCCDGAINVTQHLLVELFPGIERAPFKVS